jgi:hypothetical protein
MLETLAQTWLAWFIATAFAYKYCYTISIIHVSRTRAGLKLDFGHANYFKDLQSHIETAQQPFMFN